jgi:succinate dehydrogenase / fumarate reductase flavoprotein subunit
MDSAYLRKESRGAHARDDFPKRDDEKFMKHTLSWCNGKETKIDYRPVHKSTLTSDVQYFPPQERVYRWFKSNTLCLSVCIKAFKCIRSF